MFYAGASNHGLRYDPFKAIVAPRPIGWISTLDAQGRPNLAPYSFFNAVSTDPHLVAFFSDGLKDSARNARDTGEFVHSLAIAALTDPMNASCTPLPPGESEWALAGLEPAPSRLVKPARVAASPASLECKVTLVQRLDGLQGTAGSWWMVVGEVVGVHIDDAYLSDGRFDTARAQPIARCGYKDYTTVTGLWELERPSA